MNQNQSNAYYEVKAVAKISGLSPHTIRTWERRNFIRTANRSATGRRQYSKEQVDRLVLLKKLTQLGDSISALAQLTQEELSARLAEFHHVKSVTSTNRALIIKVFTKQAYERLTHLPEQFSLIPPSEEGIPDADSRNPDLLLVEAEESAEALQIQVNIATAEHPEVPIVLIYTFLPSERLRSLGRQGYFLIKQPIPPELLEQYLATAAGRCQNQESSQEMDAIKGDPPERILTDNQLAAIASSDPGIACECPHHMSALVLSLNAFENYCKRCEVDSPKDAILHAHLAKEVGHSRHRVEKALSYLCESDQTIILE